MVKTRTSLYDAIALLLIAVVASCGDSSTPTAPSVTPIAGETLAALSPDGVISLKTLPPVLESPIENLETEGLTPVLTITNSEPRFINSADFTYRFEVYTVDESGAMVRVHVNSVAQTPNTTSYLVNEDLEQTTTHMWRARAEIGDEKGPWSVAATFRTPLLLGVPTPVSPIDGATTLSTLPTFIVQNGEAPAGAGTVTHEIQLDADSSFPDPTTISVPRAPGTLTTVHVADALASDTMFYWRVRATDGTNTTDWSETLMFRTPDEALTPDPPPGSQLPLPNESATVAALATLHPGPLGDSCQEEGGTWEFMDIVLGTLRLKDTRWGFNCKRGNCGDISLDVIDYFWGVGDGQGSNQVYIIDIIGGHCGPNPGPAWIDQTDETAAAGAEGGWVWPRP